MPLQLSCAILLGVAERIVPPQWHRLAAEPWRGTVMILGASDTGKSTLACYLFEEMGRRGDRVAYLDLDLGQGSLGPPTTLGARLAVPGGDGGFPAHGDYALYFVGSCTPRGHMLPAVVGAHRLQQKALTWGAEVVLVDTTGLVDPTQGGKALKQWKIELLAPQAVIALQRAKELEPILWPLRRGTRVRTIELPACPHVVERSREERIARRQARLRAYFEGSRLLLVKLGALPVYDLDQLAVGGLLALQDAEGLTLALGIVERIEKPGGMLTIRTPLSTLDKVDSLRLGSVRLDPDKRCER